MISRIQAQRYRCFRELDVDFSQYNLLVGGNGSGKSTLMDIPLLFADLLSSNNLIQAFLEPSPLTNIARAQRLQDVVHCYRGDTFGFALEASLPQHVLSVLDDPSRKRQFHTLRYAVRFQIFNDIELHVVDEFLWLIPETTTPHENQIGDVALKNWKMIIGREPGSSIKVQPETRGRSSSSLRIRPGELVLRNIPLDETLFPASSWFIRMLQTGTILYEPNVAKLQQDSRLVSISTILPDASNLPWMVLNLQQEQTRMFDLWVSHVQTALPSLKHIEAIRREDEFHAFLQVTYDGGYTVPSSGLSVGTLRILALTILPYLSNPPEIICLEEPENGVHPRAIEAILESLSSLYDSQILFTTHSPIVLASTELPAVIVMSSEENGEKKAIVGKLHPRLENWRGEINLGSLFAAGVLDT